MLSELLRPLDDRDRMRGERMARAAKQRREAVRRRRLTKLIKHQCRRGRRTQRAPQLAGAPQPL